MPERLRRVPPERPSHERPLLHRAGEGMVQALQGIHAAAGDGGLVGSVLSPAEVPRRVPRRRQEPDKEGGRPLRRLQRLRAGIQSQHDGNQRGANAHVDFKQGIIRHKLYERNNPREANKSDQRRICQSPRGAQCQAGGANHIGHKRKYSERPPSGRNAIYRPCIP